MAVTVGSMTFDMQEGGPVRKAGQNVETWTVPGLDGVGIRTVGKQAPPTTWQLIKFDAAANLYTLITTATGLLGTLVNTTDQFGASETNVLLLAMPQPPLVETVIVNGVAAARMTMTLELVKT